MVKLLISHEVKTMRTTQFKRVATARKRKGREKRLDVAEILGIVESGEVFPIRVHKSIAEKNEMSVSVSTVYTFLKAYPEVYYTNVVIETEPYIALSSSQLEGFVWHRYADRQSE